MAKVELTGDFITLNYYMNDLRELPRKSMFMVSRQLQETAIDLVREGIENGEDPYGKTYPSLVLREGKPLQDTGGLKVWFAGERSGKGFGIYSPKAYALYHQEGTGIYGPLGKPIKPIRASVLRIPIRGGAPVYARSVKGTPQRKMVPDAGPLPKAWSDAFVETTQDVFTELLK